MPGLYTHSDCAPPHLVQAGLVLDLTAPVQEEGVTSFRSTLYLRLPLDERCQGLVLAPGSTLQVRFDPATVQVTRSSSAWVTDWEENGPDRSTVRLAYPAPIVRVHSDIYAEVDLHRVDGDAVSEKPTVSANTGQTLTEAFVAPAFQAAFSGQIPQAVAKVVQDKRQARQTRNFQSLSAAAVQGEINRTGDPTYDEMKVAAIMESALGRLDLRGRPTTPRLRLMSADESENLWQWLEPGEHAGPITYSAQAADLAGQLQPALDRALALRQGSETQMVLPLIVESDAPCRVTIQQAHLEFQLQAELLAQPAQLSFAGGSEQTQLVSIEVPAVQPVRLELQASVALRDPRTAGEPGALADGRTGVRMEAGAQAAALWEADRPYWLIGMAIAWYGLSGHAVLNVSLLPEAGGPAAATGSLARAALDAPATGAAWLRFQWPQLPLQPGRYWVRLQVDEGSGLWLGETGQEPVPVWQQSPPGEGAAIAIPLSLLLAPMEPAPAALPEQPPLLLRLNGVALSVSSPRADMLTAAAEPPAIFASASPWALEAVGAHDMSVTFQSARLTYQA